MRSAAHLPAGWLPWSPHPPPPGRWAPRTLRLTATLSFDRHCYGSTPVLVVHTALSGSTLVLVARYYKQRFPSPEPGGRLINWNPTAEMNRTRDGSRTLQ